MFLLNIYFMFIVAANSITECLSLSFRRNITEGEVNGKKIKFCEYKLIKMLPKSKIQDAEACLFCKCREKGLICTDIKNDASCEKSREQVRSVNPSDSSWTVMVDRLIDSKYVGKYQVLQAELQVDTGNMYFKLLVIDRICELVVSKSLPQPTMPSLTKDSLKNPSVIITDSCGIGKPRPEIYNHPAAKIIKPVTKRPGLPSPYKYTNKALPVATRSPRINKPKEFVFTKRSLFPVFDRLRGKLKSRG